MPHLVGMNLDIQGELTTVVGYQRPREGINQE